MNRRNDRDLRISLPSKMTAKRGTFPASHDPWPGRMMVLAWSRNMVSKDMLLLALIIVAAMVIVASSVYTNGI